MAGEWTLTEIGDLAESISDTHSRDKERLIFLNTSDVLLGKILHNNYSEVRNWPGQAKKSIRRGDILFSEIRPANGRYAFVDVDADDYVVSTKLMVIRTRDERLLPRFLYHFLTSTQITRWLQHLAESRSGTFPQITFDQVAELELALPPRRQQEAITAFLDAIDDKIELNRRRNRTLEALARAIFQSWFVDFDPVKAKAAGRTPPGLSPALAALFPDSFTDSPLGPIPKGWRVGTVGDVAEFNGWTLGKRDELDEIDYIEISEVMRGEIANITRYTRGTEPGRARRRLRHGDTAISTVRPERGSYFLSIEPSPKLLASTGFAVLTAKNCHWVFAHVLVTRDEFGQELGRLADGGAYPAVRPEVIAARPVVIPAENELLTNFEKAAQPLFLHAESSRKESRSLAALRDALLPKLISGDLRVPDAEPIVGRAV
jgi:type I restriction enzyme S subunit